MSKENVIAAVTDIAIAKRVDHKTWVFIKELVWVDISDS